MANTDLSYYANDTYIGGPHYVMWFEAGDGNMKAGYLCMDDGSDAGEVKVCATDGDAFGAIAKDAIVDIDTAISVGESVKLYLPVGTLLRLKHDGTDQSVTRGVRIQSSDSVAGAIENIPAYADTTERSDWGRFFVGFGAELKATGGTAIWVDCVLQK
jgi:hypothetical protein